MPEIIRKWLANRLGLLFDLSAENFGKTTRDGRLIAHILHSYEMISEDQLKVIIASNDPNIAQANFRHIKIWLHDLRCEDRLYDEVCCGNAQAAIKLLYQLYLFLENKDRLYFLAKKKQPSLSKASESFKFKVEKTVKASPEHLDSNCNPLENALLTQKEVIIWYRNRYQQIEKQLVATRTKYHNYFDTKCKNSDLITKQYDTVTAQQNNEYEHFCVETQVLTKNEPCAERNFTFQELLGEVKQVKTLSRKAPKSTAEILARIKQKVKSVESSPMLESSLIRELWHSFLEKENVEFDKLIAKKIIKQPEYEKQMTEKCLEVKSMKNVVIENRKIIENMVQNKEEAQSIVSLFEHQEEITDSKHEFEKERIVRLHRKLYREKVLAKRAQHVKSCSNIVEALVDLAVMDSTYRNKYGTEVPDHLKQNWITLFLNNQPIFDLIRNVESVLLNIPADIDEVHGLELERQDVLNKKDFEEYLNYTGEWDPYELGENSTIPEQDTTNGLRILGHIVHRLLLIKYPVPIIQQPPNLPVFSIAVSVIGLPNTLLFPVLKRLLEKYQCVLFEPQTAINYCLKMYQEEMLGIEDIQLHLQAETLSITNLSDVRVPSTISAKSKKDGKSVVLSRQSKMAKPPIEETISVQTQTPKKIPIDDYRENLSEAAVLGLYLYESMSLGKPLTDLLIAKIVVEYLKTLTNAKGWVLFNYPVSLVQANVLETLITGKPTGIDFSRPDFQENLQSKSVVSLRSKSSRISPKISKSSKVIVSALENIAVSSESIKINIEDPFKSLYDPDKERRQSKLIANPNFKSCNEKDYNTFYTAFISIKKQFVTNLTPVEKFYTEQGACYFLNYENFDFNTVVYLAKLIIGDFTLPLKSSQQLFGDVYSELKNEFDDNLGENYFKSFQQMGGKEKEYNDIDQKMDEKENVLIDTINLEASAQIFVNPVNPGDLEWVFVNNEIDPNLGHGIATIWENLELIYLNDLQEVLFIKRSHRNTIVPYLKYVTEHMHELQQSPDEKQALLHKFQLMYNDIPDDIRDDGNVRGELHCRVNELRDDLWKMCDKRMRELEAERLCIINENWIADQLVFLMNIYISIMQLEFDRYSDTLGVISDYYTVMIGLELHQTEDFIAKAELPKIETIQRTKVQPTTNPNNGLTTTDISLTKLSKNYTNEGLLINKSINRALLDNAEKRLEETYLQTLTQNIQSSTMNLVDTLGERAFKYLLEQRPNLTKKNVKSLEKLASEETEISKEKNIVTDEWFVALGSEIVRTKFRMWSILQKMNKDLGEIFNSGMKTFHGVFKEIVKHYEVEVANIKTISTLLLSAIENQSKIPYELVLSNDDFFVCDSTLLYPIPTESEICAPLLEPEKAFTGDQLAIWLNLFYDLAPTGSIPERLLIFILQDFISQQSNLPFVWYQLDPLKLGSVLEEAFGDSEFIDWRDFLIYNMNIRFPNEFEVLKVFMTYQLYDDEKCELISRKYYHYVQLWFEFEDDGKRTKIIKNILFRMFEVKKDYCNYSGLLLAFCKDTNPTVGMAKAFSLSLRSLVEWDSLKGRLRELEDMDTLEVESGSTEVNSAKYNCTCGDFVIEDVDRISSSTIGEPLLSPSACFAESIGLEEEIERISFDSLTLAHTYSDPNLPMYQNRTYELPFDEAVTTLSAALPWHIRTQSIENQSLHQMIHRIYNDLKGTRNSVYVHKFLQHETIFNFFKVCFKFKSLSIPEIVERSL